MTYSSINTNSFDGYGEKVMGSQGNDDRRARRRRSCCTRRRATPARRGRPAYGGDRARSRCSRPARARPARAAASALGGLATADPSRGYREELEHFAYCVRHGDASDYHDDKEHQPRCRGEVALADAVIALTSNIAMRQKRRIEFDPAWFDSKFGQDTRIGTGHCPHLSDQCFTERATSPSQAGPSSPACFYSHPVKDSETRPRTENRLESKSSRFTCSRTGRQARGSFLGSTSLMEWLDGIGPELVWGLLALQQRFVSRPIWSPRWMSGKAIRSPAGPDPR